MKENIKQGVPWLGNSLSRDVLMVSKCAFSMNMNVIFHWKRHYFDDGGEDLREMIPFRLTIYFGFLASGPLIIIKQLNASVFITERSCVKLADGEFKIIVSRKCNRDNWRLTWKYIIV